MKYIRTKNGIQQYEGYCDLSYIYQAIGGIKIADTIEELCDVFVLKDKDNLHFTKNADGNKYRFATKDNGFRSLQQTLNEHFVDKDTEIYGAIWTDKGLIYVAKMNESGQLELL